MTEKANNYKRLTPKESARALAAVKDPIVMIHVRPDGDAVGTGAALCEIYRQLGKETSLISQDKIPDRLEFILEKTGVSIAQSAAGKTPVTVDVASPSQLGSLYSADNAPVFMIDHHAVGEMLCDGYIRPDASSAAEALLDIVDALIDSSDVVMTESLAYALYAAISSDTGCFCYSNTSPKTHMRAAELIGAGIDFADINHRLFCSKSIGQIKAEGFVGANIKTAEGGKIGYASITHEDMKSLSLTAEDFETAIDIVRSLAGCEIAVTAKEAESGKYKISLRSTGSNVAKVAKIFGGGGHVRAAGCTVPAQSADEALEKIIKELILI